MFTLKGVKTTCEIKRKGMEAVSAEKESSTDLATSYSGSEIFH
jgi:hypothetical protein